VRLIIFLFLLLSITAISPSVVNAFPSISTPSSDLKMRDAAKEKRTEFIEMMKAKREEFNKRLQTIGDEGKRMLVERIDTKMGRVNQSVTNRFSIVLDKLQSILNRFIGKAQDAKAKGIDTSAVDSAIESAQIALGNAKTLAASQAANLYVVDIASQSALRVSVGSVVSQLRSDLRDVHKAMVDAKQAVQKVVMEFAKLRRNELNRESTATGSSQ
jgi:hypothetical protein